jgi:O-antigen/teichoic acid export membrane protein
MGARTGRPFLTTSLGLVTGRVASMATGFLFWLLAAHAADASAVGLAAGAVSLMMLGTQLAVAGTGSAYILTHGRLAEQRKQLLDAALTLVLLTSTVAAVLALVLVGALSEQLRAIASSPVFAVLFVAMTVLGTLNILLDHVSVALERGSQVLVRNCAGGLLTAAPLLAAPLLRWSVPAEGLFALWVLGGILACSVGAVQLHRQLDGYTYRPRLPRALVRDLVRTGLPNHALTLVERAPNLLMPVVVTEVLSPRLNAYWYVAWMMAWAVLVVPISVGMTLLAQVAKEPDKVRAGVGRAARSGGALGLAAAAGVAVIGPFVLLLLGPGYSEAGTAPLRILLLGVVPVLVIQIYFAVCRSAQRLREAVTAGTLTAVASIGCTAAVAAGAGLPGMAWAWVAVQAVSAVWAGWRLRTLLRSRRTARSAASPAPAGPVG